MASYILQINENRLARDVRLAALMKYKRGEHLLQPAICLRAESSRSRKERIKKLADFDGPQSQPSTDTSRLAALSFLRSLFRSTPSCWRKMKCKGFRV